MASIFYPKSVVFKKIHDRRQDNSLSSFYTSRETFLKSSSLFIYFLQMSMRDP